MLRVTELFLVHLHKLSWASSSSSSCFAAASSWPSEKAIGLFIRCQWKRLLSLERDEEKRGVAESYPVGSGADTVLAASRTLPPLMIFWHLFTDRPHPRRPLLREWSNVKRALSLLSQGNGRKDWGQVKLINRKIVWDFQVCFAGFLTLPFFWRYSRALSSCPGADCLITPDCLSQEMAIIAIQSDTMWSTRFSEKPARKPRKKLHVTHVTRFEDNKGIFPRHTAAV